MTDAECVQVYNQLENTAQQNGLRWMVEEVRYFIRAGSHRAITVDAYKQGTQRSLVRSGKTELVESVAYSPKEQLRILLDALERVIADITELALHTIGTLSEYSPDYHAVIVFRNDENEQGESLSDNPELDFTRSDLNNLSANSKLFRELLSQLRREIDAN